MPGACPGVWREVEPAPADDPRTHPLVALLTTHRWTHLTATSLCRRLLGLLEDAPR